MGSRSAGPWIVIAVSGAAAVGGAVMLAVALGDIAKVEEAKPNTRWYEVEASYDRAPMLSTVGSILIGVGAAGALGGLIWHASEGDDANEIALQLAPTGVKLRGSW
jgi:hypothetical protein